MATQIHPQAMVSSGADLDENVTIGAYAVIEDNVKLGARCVVESFAQLRGHTEVGKDCHISSYAVIGSPPQDLKYKGQRSYIIIGDNNIIREFVTINPGTEKDSKTIIGDNNLIMVYSHIAHDCRLGSNNILANCATLAGHVTIEDRVMIGGLVAVHQFCRLGRISIVGGCSKVVQDVCPYTMYDGHPVEAVGLNTVGLKRANISSEVIRNLKKAFRILFFDNHSVALAKELLKKELPSLDEIDYLLQFISSSKRGISR